MLNTNQSTQEGARTQRIGFNAKRHISVSNGGYLEPLGDRYVCFNHQGARLGIEVRFTDAANLSAQEAA